MGKYKNANNGITRDKNTVKNNGVAFSKGTGSIFDALNGDVEAMLVEEERQVLNKVNIGSGRREKNALVEITNQGKKSSREPTLISKRFTKKSSVNRILIKELQVVLRELGVAVPDQLERRFAKLISAVDALREDVRKSDLERKESDKVKEKQYKELVTAEASVVGVQTEQDTADSSSIGAQSQQDSAAASDVGPQTQHDTVAAALVVPVNPSLQVERPVWLRKCSSQTTTFYTDPCRRKKSKTEANKFCLADPVHREHLEAYL
ncbi:hypothetical protein LWI29_002637 [Acer saccharum]|uniref:Uncharacterized protein n=1 Tax=Acer saccharum TaxID=4024 RepID=A0AA39V650_ACESA|nr:hypothetical protein LWI29_002637 [Acer saccharum]